MHMIVIRMVWPYVMRYIAQYAADFLQNWRKRRQAAPAAVPESVEHAAPVECPPCPPCPVIEEKAGAEVTETAPAGSNSKGWFALSGILLGASLGLVGYLFLRDRQP